MTFELKRRLETYVWLLLRNWALSSALNMGSQKLYFALTNQYFIYKATGVEILQIHDKQGEL